MRGPFRGRSLVTVGFNLGPVHRIRVNRPENPIGPSNPSNPWAGNVLVHPEPRIPARCAPVARLIDPNDS